jgi:hypothetical protein
VKIKEPYPLDAVMAWCKQHDEHSAEKWLALVINGEVSVEEMRCALQRNEPPAYEPWQYGNPMESDDLLMTHVMNDGNDGNTYVVALRGKFFATSREAPRRIAEVAGVPEARLQWNCHLSEHDGTVLRLRINRLGRLITDVLRPKEVK